MSEPAAVLAPRRAAVGAVADNFVDLMRTFARARARMMAAAAHDVEWSAHMVLKCVANLGPIRAGGIAEHLQSDPSTVSRQVASLVKDGLLERRADPLDGRASLLVLTDKADAVLADHDEIRLDYFARMLDGWDSRELEDFARQLAKFTTAYEKTDNEWITEMHERIAERSARSRSNA
jgi:DNA-binding MarR family transcriptional regulator